MRLPLKKKGKTGVRFKYQCVNIPKQHSAHRYCLLCNKAGMHEQIYMARIYEDRFVKHSKKKSIKAGLGVPMGRRSEAVKQYNNSEHKCREYLKDLRNQNKMDYSIVNNSGLRR